MPSLHLSWAAKNSSTEAPCLDLTPSISSCAMRMRQCGVYDVGKVIIDVFHDPSAVRHLEREGYQCQRKDMEAEIDTA